MKNVFKSKFLWNNKIIKYVSKTNKTLDFFPKRIKPF